MDLINFSSFLIASFIIILMPGTDNIFVLTESLSKGYRNGIALSVGLATGVLIHTLLAATGVSLIIKHSFFLFQMIKVVGALYMFYIAISSLREKHIHTVNNENDNNDFDFLKIAQKGFIMNVLNPKVALFFIAFIPQFVSISSIRPIYQMTLFGVIFMIQTLIIFSLIALISSKLARFLNRPRVWKYTKYSKALILFSIALYLLFSV